MPPKQLERKLGLWASVSIVAGSVIGSGVFMKPAIMAGQVGSPVILILVWLVAGIISLFGGMINAEVGTLLPNTGGQYVFFQKMYGDFFAFLYGWAAFIVINTAAIAAIAFVFAQYAEYFVHLPKLSSNAEHSWVIHIPGIGSMFPLENIGVKFLAAFILLLITGVNYYSVKAGGAVQVFFTIIKVAALLLLTAMILFSGKGSTENFFNTPSLMQKTGWNAVLGFVAATSGALGAYDGWNNLGFVAGEIKNPKRNIPLGLFIGIAICIGIYILTNLAYLYAMPIDKMKDSALVASDALKDIAGIAGGGFIAVLVMISTFGAVNGNVLPCARIQFAMANEGVFFKSVGAVHPKFNTPGYALLLQAFWACLFLFTGSFDMLFDVFVFITWIFYGFAAFGVFILRKKMPNAERPYKVWGYPVVPVIFILFSTLYFFLTLYNDVNNYILGNTTFINSVYGLVLTSAGIPLYFYFKKKSQK